MGQGSDSCGGYETDYCPYEEGLADGVWTMRDGSIIHVKDMTASHLRGAIRVADRASMRATFSSDEEMWDEWVELLKRALGAKGEELYPVAVYVSPAAIKPTRGAKTAMVCHCGAEYEARNADIARGWGLSCSKRCSSIRRELRRPAAKPKA